MKYFIDSTDLKEIRKWRKILGRAFAGVTTNTAMLPTTEDKVDFLDKFMKHFPSVPVMVQIDEDTDISKVARAGVTLKASMIQPMFEVFNETFEHFKAATTCYDIIQINHAIEAGAQYSMVYYDKNEYKGLLEDAVALKKASNSEIGLVAASIHDRAGVIKAINSGIDYVTVRPDVLEKLFNNDQAIKDISSVKEALCSNPV